MLHKNLTDRFRVTQQELDKLKHEFNSEAFPLLEKLYRSTYWIVFSKFKSNKIIKQIYSEVIEDCTITKNHSDWESWIYRIWMREIHEHCSKQEHSEQVFNFIEQNKLDQSDVEKFLNTETNPQKLTDALKKIPAILRIPVMINVINEFNYEKTAELIDVPTGVIATRIYRGRKFLYLVLSYGTEFSSTTNDRMNSDLAGLIFDIRKSAMLVDGESEQNESTPLEEKSLSSKGHQLERLIQEKVKKAIVNNTSDTFKLDRLKSKIELKARKRFRKS